MVFTSISFLFIFLPISLLLYYLTPRNINARNTVLLILSLVFYAYGDLYFTFHLIVLTTINYFVSHYLDKISPRKRIFISALTLNLLILAFYKYVPSLIHFISPETSVSSYLPLGISFFTFQNISYLADVYNGKTYPAESLRDYLLYILFFPQLIAGPIVKYADIKCFLSERNTDINKVYRGFSRLSIGLFKKVILAENLAVIADTMFGSTLTNLPLPYAWLGAVAYMFQIYYDFSGYSDIAIGLGTMFGFKYSENFNHPYLTDSVSDFFRRWHMTLTSFFREYVYIPLGGNRCGRFRTAVNTLVVFTLTGLWHGPSLNYIMWGTFNGVLIAFEKALSHRPPKLIRRLTTILLILTGWVLFRSPSIVSALSYFKAMTLNPVTLHYGTYLYRFINLKYILVFLIAFLLAGPHLYLLRPTKKLSTFLIHVLPPVLFVLSFLKIIISTYKPFIYFRF